MTGDAALETAEHLNDIGAKLIRNGMSLHRHAYKFLEHGVTGRSVGPLNRYVAGRQCRWQEVENIVAKLDDKSVKRCNRSRAEKAARRVKWDRKADEKWEPGGEDCQGAIKHLEEDAEVLIRTADLLRRQMAGKFLIRHVRRYCEGNRRVVYDMDRLGHDDERRKAEKEERQRAKAAADQDLQRIVKEASEAQNVVSLFKAAHGGTPTNKPAA